MSALGVTRSGGVLELTLDRPDRRNALDSDLRRRLVETFEEAAGDDEVGVVLLTGAGDVFCAGFDLKELASGDAAAIFAEADHYHRTIHGFPKPVVGAINGPALAGGFDLALFCDVRIAARSASFGQPQVRLGLPASYELVRATAGDALARDLCLTGRALDADEALRGGIVSSVVDDVLDVARGIAAGIVASGGHADTKRRILAAQPVAF